MPIANLPFVQLRPFKLAIGNSYISLRTYAAREKQKDHFIAEMVFFISRGERTPRLTASGGQGTFGLHVPNVAR